MQPAKLLSPQSPSLAYPPFYGLQDYRAIYNKMRAFTLERHIDTPDEVWLLEHYPVFTQGQAGKAEHILQPSSIPIVLSDRGGQITYHGPGQIMIYCLIDLHKRNMRIRQFIDQLENSILAVLKHYNIIGYLKPEAPGIYVGDAKIASMGLRVRKGCTYHGIALNVSTDLSPFLMINPCGYKNLKIVNMIDYAPAITLQTVYQTLTEILPMFLI